MWKQCFNLFSRQQVVMLKMEMLKWPFCSQLTTRGLQIELLNNLHFAPVPRERSDSLAMLQLTAELKVDSTIRDKQFLVMKMKVMGDDGVISPCGISLCPTACALLTHLSHHALHRYKRTLDLAPGQQKTDLTRSVNMVDQRPQGLWLGWMVSVLYVRTE